MQNESISLYFRDGSSDKVYNASLEAQGAGFVVNFAFGRRGSSLATGTKTASPVDYAKAKKAYDKLIQEKTAKGYKPAGTAPAAINTVVKTLADRNTGLMPQLLNPIEETELERFFKSDAFGLQPKHDGRRLMVQKKDGKVIGANRKGQEIPLRQELIDVLSLYPDDFILDGEDCGDRYWIFDCLLIDQTDIHEISFSTRWETACRIVNRIQKDDNCPTQSGIAISTLDRDEHCKRGTFAKLKKENAEGVVFKTLSAGYHPGRPSSGGNAVKFKFVATTTCRVAGQNGTKRSVGLTMACGTDVGNVTIPANFDIPKAGELVEIRYLYAYKGGSLFQPVYLGVRDDIDHPDTKESLKYKAEGGDDE